MVESLMLNLETSSAGLASRRRFGVHRRHHRNHTEKNPQLAGALTKPYCFTLKGSPCTSPEFKVRIGVSWTSPENASLLLFGSIDKMMLSEETRLKWT
ncbi:hypothetical protein HanXRQr2_Chr09g0374871 [Helianthus annuus]|uniref:Uncharacterized protein n=1 Tax=Helianthus annuus TaxID=4232 RepID=A0A251TT01_HELAN|nr:hypothetical protein HanXRQr2_Chr09g0374871 [Helianthus annuus]KAJ0892061.1 hypothetical protein HanPSC8_Chr09g0361421 [Helianthus annuus]